MTDNASGLPINQNNNDQNNEKGNGKNNEQTYRQYDFKFVIALLVILAYILKLTLSFPMSGSYGGVENQWYVSPALFPLILLTALFLCCISLLMSSIKQQGHQHFFSLAHWLGNKDNQQVRDRWLIIGLLIGYVYLLIPATDFYLATAVFVCSLTSIFYLQIDQARRTVIAANILLAATLVTIRSTLNEDPSISILDINDLENSILYCDLSTGFTLISLVIWQVICGSKIDKPRVMYNLIAVLIVPLILVMAFSFLLYVPMPVEYGSVISFLNWLIYEQLGI
ncbi:hypothetical protein L0668_18595 [Paraglaciecola aquimarina]|uniref:DUF1468 domain-containing protein n=1 Tax=Paraglaciecola algarum TaxID=3050085 RepID=A0ABS9DCQ3_9ALTE|nr:tripartite tricarboxylate transporter TctB family protein [Paraglaciecola sp. G1-23]MCF2950130.1 hypothetical protein [Paraglaciecola sp. G1-23]